MPCQLGNSSPGNWQGTVFLKHEVRPRNGACPLEVCVRSGFLTFPASSNKKIRCWNVKGSAMGPLAEFCKLLKDLTHTSPVIVRDTAGVSEEFQHWE